MHLSSSPSSDRQYSNLKFALVSILDAQMYISNNIHLCPRSAKKSVFEYMRRILMVSQKWWFSKAHASSARISCRFMIQKQLKDPIRSQESQEHRMMTEETEKASRADADETTSSASLWLPGLDTVPVCNASALLGTYDELDASKVSIL